MVGDWDNLSSGDETDALARIQTHVARQATCCGKFARRILSSLHPWVLFIFCHANFPSAMAHCTGNVSKTLNIFVLTSRSLRDVNTNNQSIFSHS